MMKKLIIVAGIVFAFFIIFLLFLGGSVGTKNAVSSEKLQTKIGTISCKIEDEENEVNYDINLFTNKTNFDNAIQNKPYSKLKFNLKSNLKSYGLIFQIKADCELTLFVILYKNTEVLKQEKVQIGHNYSLINLLLNESVNISREDEFYLVLEQVGNVGFQFDNLTFYEDEVIDGLAN